jgi:hypothetical protein
MNRREALARVVRAHLKIRGIRADHHFRVHEEIRSVVGRADKVESIRLIGRAHRNVAKIVGYRTVDAEAEEQTSAGTKPHEKVPRPEGRLKMQSH